MVLVVYAADGQTDSSSGGQPGQELGLNKPALRRQLILAALMKGSDSTFVTVGDATSFPCVP